MTTKLVITVSEAAQMLRTRPNWIIERLELGEIPAYREGRNWKIPLKLLESYIENKALAESRGRRESSEGENDN